MRFLQAHLNLNAIDPAALAADCALIEADAPVMRILRSFWQVSAHVLSDPANHDQLHNQLIDRLDLHTDAQPDIAATRQTWGECVPPVRYATSGDTPHGFRRCCSCAGGVEKLAAN